MIYYVRLLNDLGDKKTSYLTADDHNKLYRRILSTYNIPKNKVEILEEYKETDNGGYKLKKKYKVSEDPNKETEPADEKIILKAKEIFSKSRKLSGENKSDYKQRLNFSEVSIEKEEDLYPLLQKYKKVKVYFDTGKKRGDRKYYSLVK